MIIPEALHQLLLELILRALAQSLILRLGITPQAIRSRWSVLSLRLTGYGFVHGNFSNLYLRSLTDFKILFHITA